MLNPLHPCSVLDWEISAVLRALPGPPFKLVESTIFGPFRLRLPSCCLIQVGDLQALDPSCIEFCPYESKVVLSSRKGFVPKVLYTPFRAQVIVLPALLLAENSVLSGSLDRILSSLVNIGN